MSSKVSKVSVGGHHPTYSFESDSVSFTDFRSVFRQGFVQLGSKDDPNDCYGQYDEGVNGENDHQQHDEFEVDGPQHQHDEKNHEDAAANEKRDP